MTALLTENLPLLAGAPNGIKKLRELILELAVRGKLVPQDPSDEPASELLKRIAEEKARLVAEGKLKKQKPLAKIAEGEKPFATPANWEWVRLDALLKKIGAGSTPLGGKQAYVADGVKFLRSQNVWNEGLRLNEVAFIPEETHQKMSGTHVEAGDLLFNITGASIGRCAAVPTDFDTGNVSQHVTIIRPVSGETQPFLHVVLVSQLVQQTVMDVQVGVSREGLSIGKLAQFLIPFPPEAEQHRIVAKVDELMALCDRLEAQQAGAESAHVRLVQALLDSLTQASDAIDFATSWQRLVEHFHTLFITESSIDTLKQTLLQLAVMGKLAPQDLSEESLNFHSFGTKTPKLVDEKIALYSVPSQWHWIKLCDLLEEGRDISYGIIKLGTEPKQGGVPTLRCSDVKPGYIDLRGLRRVAHDIEQDYVRTRLRGGEILINIRGTLGGVAVVDKKLAGYNVAREVAVVPLNPELNAQYLSIAMQSSYFWRRINQQLRGIAYKGLNLGALRLFPIPIPPVAEQHRIVAKVDQLMTLCDQLKTRLTQARQLNEQLASTLVEQSAA